MDNIGKHKQQIANIESAVRSQEDRICYWSTNLLISKPGVGETTSYVMAWLSLETGFAKT